jgi:hypothetical protein
VCGRISAIIHNGIRRIDLEHPKETRARRKIGKINLREIKLKWDCFQSDAAIKGVRNLLLSEIKRNYRSHLILGQETL